MRSALFTAERRLFFLLIGLLAHPFSPATVFGQAPDQRQLGIRGGVVLGINASQVDGDDYWGYYKVGLNGGFYGQIPLSRVFYVSTEILYSQQGAKSKTYQGVPLEYRSQLSYALVPVLFHFQEKEAVNFGVGFSFGRLVSQRYFADEIEQPDPSFCTGKPDISTIDPSYLCMRKNDYSVVADASYLFTPQFMINVRFSYSMRPIGYYGSSNYVHRGMYNNLLSFRLLYVFGGNEVAP